MHQFQRVEHHKIQVKFDKGVIRKILTELWRLFDLDLG